MAVCRCGETEPDSVPTFWNGERCQAERVTVRVGKALKPTWWCASLEGTERNAVKVTYKDSVFFLDDENGAGWHKVTTGQGSPWAGHKSLPDDSVVI